MCCASVSSTVGKMKVFCSSLREYFLLLNQDCHVIQLWWLTTILKPVMVLGRGPLFWVLWSLIISFFFMVLGSLCFQCLVVLSLLSLSADVPFLGVSAFLCCVKSAFPSPCSAVSCFTLLIPCLPCFALNFNCLILFPVIFVSALFLPVASLPSVCIYIVDVALCRIVP